ncbi:MAG TPA: DUF5667 domain-containing protein [Patescibacteria group bacterium]|nr:DUF5667 domain-containing protein [Patescibacteria group bacterium]
MDPEKIIDEISNRLSRGRDISFWQNDPKLAPIVSILSKLSGMPKTKIPQAEFARVRSQIATRINSPSESKLRRGFWSRFPAYAKFTTAIVGSVLIVISLGIGTAVAAMQSVPGQTIYPLKKIVENVQLKLTRDPAARANLQIKFANNRLDELSTVLAQNQAGVIPDDRTQAIVSQTISDLQKSTAAALNSSNAAPSASSGQVTALNKLVDLSNKQTEVLTPLLSAASIADDGQVKIVVQQALQTSQISKEEAIKNMENAGLKVDDNSVTIDEAPANQTNANGTITALTDNSVSIGTATFLLTDDTKYVNIKRTDLKQGLAISITGEVQADQKTYALTITAVSADTSSDSNNEAKDSSGSDTDKSTSNDTNKDQPKDTQSTDSHTDQQ